MSSPTNYFDRAIAVNLNLSFAQKHLSHLKNEVLFVFEHYFFEFLIEKSLKRLKFCLFQADFGSFSFETNQRLDALRLGECVHYPSFNIVF